jgi:hypothetical protein
MKGVIMIRNIIISISVTVIFIGFFAVQAFPANDPHRFDPFLGTQWYGLYMRGAKIGYVQISYEKTSAPVDGWRSQTIMNISMKMGDQNVKMATDDIRIYKSPDGELVENKWITSNQTGNIELTGQEENGKYEIISNIGGEKSDKILNYPLEWLDSALYVENYILSGNARIGDSLNFTVFEPTPPLTGLIHQKGQIKTKEMYIFNGVPTSIYQINFFIPEVNITNDVKIDSSGTTIEASLGGPMIIRLETEDQAKMIDNTYDILTDNLIIPDKIIKNPAKLEMLKLRITGIDSSNILQTCSQSFQADSSGLSVEIQKQSTPKNSPDRPIVSNEMVPYLRSDPYEQSDDPKIIELAKKIVGDEKNSWESAKKINAWVYTNIEKQFTPDLSNALQTLNSRKGDCGEHTALAVALLRAAGIPARPIIGLIYWPPGNGFGYHAWAEAYVGEWVQLDPSWGEDLANPSHIALVRGDIISQTSVLSRVMGKMKIEIIEAK